MSKLLDKAVIAAIVTFAGVLAGSPALANPIGQNLVVNGGFEQVSMTSPTEMTTTNVTGWSSTGYNFVFFPGSQTTGSYTPQFGGNVSFWNPGNGANNGFTDTSPTGGNYIGADGAFEVGPITQTLHNLDIGGDYAVSFSWAAAQQYGFTGPTSEQWIVSLGGASASTIAYQNASHGFSGWMQQTFLFEATSTDEVLSFLAVGTPNGEPPFSLLDGVSAQEVPEPAAWALLAAGLLSLSALRLSPWIRARRKPAIL